MEKKQKIKEKRMLRRFSGPTHKDSDNLKVIFVFIVAEPKLCFVLCGATKGAAFSLRVFMIISFLQ
jgi:hypothetical protein